MRKVDPVRHGEKRREILEAAGRCFVRDGFRGASIAAICAEARISPGHLYHYFSSKEAIVAAMAEIRLEEAAARFGQLAEGSSVLEAFLAQLDRLNSRRHGAVQPLLLEMLSEAGRDPAMAKVVQDTSRAGRALLAEVLRKGQARGEIDASLDPEMAAALLMSLMDGAKALSIRAPDLDGKAAIELLKMMIGRFLAPGGVAAEDRPHT